MNYIFMSTHPSRPNNTREGNVRPSVGSVRPSVRTSVHKTFVRFQWNLVCR